MASWSVHRSLPNWLLAVTTNWPMSVLLTRCSFRVCWSSSGMLISYIPGLLTNATPLLEKRKHTPLIASDAFEKQDVESFHIGILICIHALETKNNYSVKNTIKNTEAHLPQCIIHTSKWRWLLLTGLRRAKRNNQTGESSLPRICRASQTAYGA